VKIEIERQAPLQDFRNLRDQLIQQGQRFTLLTLFKIPYAQLSFCCTGEAAGAACSQGLVVMERRARRRRFLEMETDELEAAQRYLAVNQMDADVRYDFTYRAAPRWEDLKPRQQVWAKLNCIYNHIDRPASRLKEAILLLRTCALEHSLPPEVAKSYMPRLRSLLTLFPGNLSPELFRVKVNEIAENIFDFLPPEEALILQREEIQGYSCTSDCFRVML
jgi:hypothetical protein